MSTHFVVQLPEQEPIKAYIQEHENGYVIELDGETFHIDVRGGPESPTRSLIVDGRAYEAATFQDKDSWDVFISGDAFRVKVMDALWAQAEVADGGSTAGEIICSPMPGSVVTLLVAEGDTVEPGQAVIVVEAMKMQNELSATASGTVTGITVAEGDIVEEDAVLMEIVPVEDTSS